MCVNVRLKFTSSDIFPKFFHNEDDDYCIFQGEDEVMFMEYRKEMKILFDNIAQLVC